MLNQIGKIKVASTVRDPLFFSVFIVYSFPGEGKMFSLWFFVG